MPARPAGFGQRDVPARPRRILAPEALTGRRARTRSRWSMPSRQQARRPHVASVHMTSCGGADRSTDVGGRAYGPQACDSSTRHRAPGFRIATVSVEVGPPTTTADRLGDSVAKLNASTQTATGRTALPTPEIGRAHV